MAVLSSLIIFLVAGFLEGIIHFDANAKVITV